MPDCQLPLCIDWWLHVAESLTLFALVRLPLAYSLYAQRIAMLIFRCLVG